MENAEQPEDDNMMDFEMDIAKWVIDKDDSVGSISSVVRTRREGSRDKSMNKENIKQSAPSTDSKSLRSFRIRKRVSYQELSSESESESIKKIEEKDDAFLSKRRSLTSNVFETSTSVCISNEVKKEIEGLNSEEISSMLSEVEDSRDYSPGSNRERLHSIENVSSTIDNKTEDTSSSSVELNVYCSKCRRTLDWCNCYQNKYKNLIKRNNLSSCGILPPDVNNKNMSVNKTSSLKIKPTKPVMTENQSLVCSICGYLSAELLIYKSHQILFHSEKTELECEYCDFKTTQCASLATHIRVHFQMDCPYCDYHCSLKSSLGTHLLRYHQNAHPYKCKTCSYSCESQSKFYDHLRMHAVRKYKCAECKELFSSKIVLESHIKKHLMTKNVFKCRKCDLRFSQKRSLKLHMKCHKKLNGLYVCSTCKLSFDRKYDFINHSKAHAVPPKTIKCEKCESTFSQGNHLKLHMRIHLPKYTKCKYCNFRSTDSSEINNHVCVSVNRLYDVQKRSLNFEGVEKDGKCNNMKTRTGVKEFKRVVSSDRNTSTRSFTFSGDRDVKSKTEDAKKSMKTRPKVLAVRQHLRGFKTEIKNERKNGNLQRKNFNLQKKLKNPEERRGRPRKRLDEKKSQTLIRNNGAFQSTASYRNDSSINKAGAVNKRQRKVVNKIKKEQLSIGLDVASLLFEQKQTLKEISVEPVMFQSGSFIECFYQSQQPSLQQHEQRHTRRPSLLSCRYCNYKTNSQQLLKCHIDKHHTWDPAVVSKLFRPTR